MPDIVISEFMDEDAVNDLARNYAVLYDPSLVDRPEGLHDVLKNARALIVRNRTQVREPLLNVASHLKVVGRLGVGLDNIDLTACAARDIAVKPATGANDAAVAEYVVAMTLVLLRDCFAVSTEVATGKWPRQSCIGLETAGKRMGFIGFGGIARQTADRVRMLGMDIAAYDPFLSPDDPALGAVELQSLTDLLAGSDVISLHVPFTDDTRNLIDSTAITAMKKGAILINTARGGIVDEEAMCAALKAGDLGGAAIDVYANEPPDESTGAKFLNIPNLILTPHIAGVTEESNVRVSRVTADNVRSVLEAL